MSALSLVRARFSKDSRVSRNRFETKLLDNNFNPETLMPSERNLADALRWGINHAMRPFLKFTDTDGTPCQIIITSIKSKDFRVQIDVKRVGSEVDYTKAVATICIEDKKPVVKAGEHYHLYKNIWRALWDEFDSYYQGQHLADYGKSNLFETDLRRIADSLLDGKILKLWPGIYAALSDDSLEAVEAVRGMLGLLDEGDVRISVLRLENTVDNRAALAEELAEEFSRSYTDIQARAEKPGPNVELLEKEMEAINSRRYNAESILGIVIPCDESQSGAEIAMLAISE